MEGKQSKEAATDPLCSRRGAIREERQKEAALSGISPSPFVSYSTLTCQSVLLTLAADPSTGAWFLSPRFPLLIYTN